MKILGLKLFNKFISLLSFEQSKKLLWSSLENLLWKNYPSVNEGGEQFCWKQLAINFKSPTIIDVGANVGKLSNFYMDLFPEGKVYAVEPITEFFNQIDDSRFSKFNLALSNKKKELTLYQSGGGSKPFPKTTKGKKTGVFKVRALPGDEFVKEFEISKVDIIKIDVEGFDFEVLQGFSEVIKKDQPLIQFELSKWWIKVGYTLKQAELFFQELNYELYNMTENGITHLNIDIPDSMFVTLNILAKPKNKYIVKIDN